jgi:hypothetical protein
MAREADGSDLPEHHAPNGGTISQSMDILSRFVTRLRVP